MAGQKMRRSNLKEDWYLKFYLWKGKIKFTFKNGTDSRLDRAGLGNLFCQKVPGSNPAQMPQVKKNG